MLSLLRWGFGTGHEHLSEKERITAAEKRNPHASGVMVPAQVKRKRGDSTQSLATPSQQRPAKRGQQAASSRGSMSKNRVTGVNGATPAGGINGTDKSNLQSSNRAAVHSNAHLNSTTQDHIVAPSDIATTATPEIPLETTSKGSADASATMPDASDLSKVQQLITEQFSLEILLKHNELRLIDQEIAKCQVALEQLRRCSVLPHPSLVAETSSRLDVASGTGLPLRPSHGHTNPRHPAPWGVTDGPYTRHYARWLLPDLEFDGGYVEEISLSARAGKLGFDRRPRGSIVDHGSRPTFGRGRRGSTGSRLQALSSGYPVPKEEKGLAVVTRQSDKKLVKLVCMDCGRENFNSAQGFINHCRIAHARSFASHEAAAQTVGVEIDAPSAESSAAQAQTPRTARTAVTTPGPMTTGSIQQFNRSLAPLLPTLLTPAPRLRSSPEAFTTSSEASQAPTEPKREPPSNKSSGTSPNSSLQLPHLSRLFAQSGRDGNLEDFVSDAMVREDLNADDSGDNDEEDSTFEDSDAPPVATTRVLARTVPRSGVSPGPSGRPHSRKGLERTTRLGVMSTPGGRGPEGHSRTHPTTTLHLSETPPNDLSPHTVESNNAPSLVSDSDGDDDYETGSGTSVPSSEAGDDDEDTNVDVDFGDEDAVRESGVHEVNIAGKSDDPELKTSGKAKAAQRNGLRGVKKGGPPKKRGMR